MVYGGDAVDLREAARGVAVREDVAALVRVSAALAVGDREVLAAALDRAAVLAKPVEVEEVLVQSNLFLGYPAALNALALWGERGGRGAADGLAPEGAAAAGGASGAEPGSGGGEWARWRARGEVVCARVYGGQYRRLRENVARLHPDLAEWMVTEGYGKVLGRPGLALEVRELCIAALLAGLDAVPQLRSHLRGSLLVGATLAQVEGALTVAGEVLPPARLAVAREVWGEVRRRWEESGGAG
jgi:4-carboxymuconolactone decarboxylase